MQRVGFGVPYVEEQELRVPDDAYGQEVDSEMLEIAGIKEGHLAPEQGLALLRFHGERHGATGEFRVQASTRLPGPRERYPTLGLAWMASWLEPDEVLDRSEQWAMDRGLLLPGEIIRERTGDPQTERDFALGQLVVAQTEYVFRPPLLERIRDIASIVRGAF